MFYKVWHVYLIAYLRCISYIFKNKLFSALTKPDIGPFHIPKDLRIGKRTFVACSVIDGDPPFRFTWLKDGKEISETDIYSIKMVDEFTSTLSLSNLSAHSNGNYTCRVSNAAGSDEKHDYLLMKGKYIYAYTSICHFIFGLFLFKLNFLIKLYKFCESKILLCLYLKICF